MLTGQTHALQQNEFLSFIISSSFWTGHLLLLLLLHVFLLLLLHLFLLLYSQSKQDRNVGHWVFSFSIITWFSVNLVKVLPGRYYSTVKET